MIYGNPCMLELKTLFAEPLISFKLQTAFESRGLEGRDLYPGSTTLLYSVIIFLMWSLLSEIVSPHLIRLMTLKSPRGDWKKTFSKTFLCSWDSGKYTNLWHWIYRLTSALWRTVEVTQKTKNPVAVRSSNPVPGPIPRQNRNSKRYLHPPVHSSTTYNS